MKKLSLYLVAITVIFAIGCTKQNENDVSKVKNTSEADASIQFLKDFQIEHYDVLYGNDAISVSTKKDFGLSKNSDYTYWNGNLRTAIDPDEFDCESTDWRDYIFTTFEDFSSDDWDAFDAWGWLLWDYYFIFSNETLKKETYGINGDFTNDINKHFNALEKFWDVEDEIILASGKSSFWSDTSKIMDILELENYYFWGSAFTHAQLVTLATNLSTSFTSDGFDDGDHPFLSLNAFAADAFVFDVIDNPNKIIMGDGVMDTYDDIDLGDVAPAAILAHEYGHQVQFANDVFFEFTPEGTRGTELMADALAAYYLTHKRGATMNWKRVQQFLEVFFNIGDCAFANPNHHGTPKQRMRAAKYGYDVAQAEKEKGKISSSADFIDAFNDAVDDIISDDE
jgi:hypothetical protein